MKRTPLAPLVKRLKKRRLGVIQGGSSEERPISLKTGNAVLRALRSWGLRPIPIEGRGDMVARLRRNKIDLAYLALHGSPGEDGTVQGMLEILGIAYTGSRVLASAVAMNKPLAKTIFRQKNVP